MRALVTGCAGFIGSHLVESLLADGNDVTGIDCFNDNYGRSQKLRNLATARDFDGFDFIPLDLARGDLHDLVSETDVIFHLAAEPGVRSSWGDRFETYLRNNLLATHHLLDAASTTAPGRRLIYASSSSIYGEAEALPTPEDTVPRPFSPYGMTKLSAEQLCHAYHKNFGVSVVSLRFFSVYGPRQRPDMAFTRFCRAMLADGPITVFGDGEQTRDFTFVGDVVDALRSAATAEDHVVGKPYNVGGGSRVSLNHAIGLLEELSGRRARVERHPKERGDVRDTGADIRRARQDLGFAPAMAFEDGLARQWEWAAREAAVTV